VAALPPPSGSLRIEQKPIYSVIMSCFGGALFLTVFGPQNGRKKAPEKRVTFYYSAFVGIVYREHHENKHKLRL
jgi:hypothetical protein